jgi:FkbM family methyltransferase
MNLVFDIGANRGRTAEIFLKDFNRVISFEPNPGLADFLKNRFPNPKLIVDRRAISHQRGSQEFKLANVDTISTLSIDWVENSRFTGEYHWNNSIIVDTITLSDAIKEYGVPDYVKIDTEGYEYEILTNFHELLPNTLLSFEWAEEQKDKILKTLVHLYSLGYNNYTYTEGDPVLYDNQLIWNTYENFKLIETLDANRKEKWGMIYFKK